MVLMMALSGTAATPATFGHGCNGYGCSGSYGCSGWGHGGYGCSGSYGCSGGWGHGGYGCSGYGCSGGGHKLFGGLFSKFGHGRHGCNGYACSGSYGCHGGWGHGGYGCSGGYGHGCYGGHFSYGCYGGHGCGGYAPVYSAPAGAPAMPAPAPAPAPAPKPEGTTPKVGSLTQATLIVSLPADAKLTIDGAETASKSAVRTFISPELKSGVDYVYTLKAEMVSNGQTVTAEKQVTVRAGVETRATIEMPVATTAAK
jgi:uncharacterized protein (TIGR03000 family)